MGCKHSKDGGAGSTAAALNMTSIHDILVTRKQWLEYFDKNIVDGRLPVSCLVPLVRKLLETEVTQTTTWVKKYAELDQQTRRLQAQLSAAQGAAGTHNAEMQALRAAAVDVRVVEKRMCVSCSIDDCD